MSMVNTPVLNDGEVIQLRSHTNRKDISFAGLKREFDVELSKQLCPQRAFYIGCAIKKTLVIPIESILFEDPETGESLQSREQVNVTTNVTELTTSLKYRGWLHSEQRLFVQEVKGKKNLYLLRSGFNRLAAAKELGWK